MKLPYTEVKFYPEVKSQTGLSSLRVSCKRALKVEPLFTIILLNETISNCVSGLRNTNLYNGKLNKKDLYKLLENATSELSFSFGCLLYDKLTECNGFSSCSHPSKCISMPL